MLKENKKAKKWTSMLCALVTTSTLLFQLPAISYGAEKNEFSLEQVVVTATKTPVKEFEANANIAVITKEQIAKNHYHDLAEALRSIPGVSIKNYGAVGEGYTANSISINGTSQIVVLINGIRANINGSTFSTFPASEFNALDNVERIEILKGSASTLYGSDAKGGVINIITGKVDGNKTTLTVTGGSYDKENYSLVNQGNCDGYSWIVTSKKDILGNYKDAHGLEVPSHQNATTNTVKITKKINDVSDVTLNYDQYKADYMRSRTNLHLDERHYGNKDNYKWQFIYNYQFADKAQNQLSFYKNKNFLNDDFTSAYNKWLMNLETIGVQDQFTKKINEKHNFTTGFDVYQDRIVDYLDSFASYKDKKITNRAVYLQDEWDVTEQWKLTSGIRYDNHSIYGNHTTPSINLGYKQDEKTNYYIAYKEFFISPNQYQLYSPYGNTKLQPETGHTIEAGLNHKLDNTLTATFHTFKRDSKDVVNWNWTGPGMYDGKYMNVDKEKSHGWDVQLNKTWSDKFKTYLGYTHTIVDAAPGKRKNIDGTLPKGSWNIDMNYQQEKYDFGLQGRGIIDKPGSAAGVKGPSFPESTYWIWDASLNYKVNKDVKAFVKVNNMFDKYYAEMSNVKWGNAGEWYTSPGRNYQFGVQYQF